MHLIRVISIFIVVLLSSCAVVCGQQFDEQFDLWPINLKINGTVVAGGGGAMPSEAVKIFLAAAKDDQAMPVTVRFEAAAGNSENVLTDEFEEIEKQTVISLSPDDVGLSRDQADSIATSKAIWIHADRRLVKKQKDVLKQVLDAAKTAVENGATVFLNGSPAEYLGRFKSDTLLSLRTIQDASDLVSDTVILESYVDETRRGELLSILAANPRCVGIGIEKDTAIVLRGRKIRVLGEGAATFCLMANEHQTLRVQHVKQAQSRRANPYETIIDLTAWRRDAIERTVEPFPAAQPPTPIVENGTLLIVGGGGMPEGLMEKMVELAGGEDARLVYVPCSESDEISGPQRTVEQWKKMGVNSATFIHTKDRLKANSDEGFLAPLESATGIWFGGGRQWNFSDSYYGTRAHELMKQVLARGGVIGGSSAGASIQARYMCRANPVANFDIMAPGYERGLGFIGGVAIDQHFSQRGRQKDMTQLVNRYPQLLGIGLDEGTAIIVTQSQAEVLGRGKVHFYDRNQPVIPGTDDFLALESGSIFDLAERQVVEKESESESDD